MPDGRVGADYEARFFRFLKTQIEPAAFPFDFKIIFVAELLKALAKSFECRVAAVAEFLIGHGLFAHSMFRAYSRVAGTSKPVPDCGESTAERRVV